MRCLVILLVLLLPHLGLAQSVDKAKSQAAHQRGEAAYKAKRYAEAVREFQTALKHWGDNPATLNDLAWLWVSATDEAFIRPRLAFPLAERAVGQQPQNDAYLDTLAVAYDKLGRHLEAARIEGRALALNPKQAEYARLVVAFSERALKTPQPAATRAELFCLAARARLVRATGKQRQATLAAALSDARQALTLAPPQSERGREARGLEGRVLAAQGDHAAAITALSAALQAKDDALLRRLLAASLSALGRHAQAATALEALVADHPADHAAWERLITARRSAKEFGAVDSAVERAIAALRLHPPLWPTRKIHQLRRWQAQAHDALATAASDPTARRAEQNAALRARVRAAIVRAPNKALDRRITTDLRALDPERAKAPLADLRRGLAVEVAGPAHAVPFREAQLPMQARGTRVALADVDGDGDPDLLLGGRRLLINNGKGRFRRVPKGGGLRGVAGVGGVFADFDRDGDLDLYVISHAPGGDRLLRNDSTRARVWFSDVTDQVGSPRDDLRSEGAAWGDLNGDGYPDLYVANYEKRGPISRGTPDRLWLSDGLGGFTNASQRIQSGPWCGRGVAMADVDQDGDTDVFVSNYRLNPDQLWLNDGAGKLVDVAQERGVAGWRVNNSWGHTIGSTWGDLDNDGDLDLVASKLAHPRFIHFSDRTRLFLQQPGGAFSAAKAQAGIAFEETHSDPTLLDVDDDGDLDLFLTSIYPQRPSFLWRNQLEAGKPETLRFVDVTWAAGVRVFNGWGAACADVDLDGDQDLVVCAGGRARLFLNQRTGAKSVRLRLVGTRSDTWGAGATAVLRDGKRRLVRQLTLGHGTTSQSEPILHFGVGARPGPFTIEVRWPSRLVSTHSLGPGLHVVREP